MGPASRRGRGLGGAGSFDHIQRCGQPSSAVNANAIGTHISTAASIRTATGLVTGAPLAAEPATSSRSQSDWPVYPNLAGAAATGPTTGPAAGGVPEVPRVRMVPRMEEITEFAKHKSMHQPHLQQSHEHPHVDDRAGLQSFQPPDFQHRRGYRK